VKLPRIIAAAGVVLALVLACASLDSQGIRTVDENTDNVGSNLDDGMAIEVLDGSEALPRPASSGRVSCEHGIPVSRSAVVEVFRPPQSAV